MKVDIYKDVDGWRWVTQAQNGSELAEAAHGYSRRIDCERMVRELLKGHRNVTYNIEGVNA